MLVAPFMGAWIEIVNINDCFTGDCVAPFMGAWIEIRDTVPISGISSVAPCMGAWIEMDYGGIMDLVGRCRTLYGCVD